MIHHSGYESLDIIPRSRIIGSYFKSIKTGGWSNIVDILNLNFIMVSGAFRIESLQGIANKRNKGGYGYEDQ
ncbi:MAG: hypothetical protein APF81_23215 [Desulfosporosinus sp. BRH_c37]|nr:MAG: hypothetical protein APF81_23215 [Desulfosporosinus sp. BRH_c37]